MNQLLQILLSGLVTGCVYGVIALGFTLIYNVSGVVNLAQGDFFAVGAFIALAVLQWAGLPLWVAGLVAVAAVMLLGLALERFVIRPARDAAIAILLVLTVGASLIAQGVLLIVFGGDAKALPGFGKQNPFSVGGIRFIPQDLWLFAFVAVVVVALAVFLRRTNTGTAMRATAMNPVGAAVTGINAKAIRLAAFGISGGLGAAAAIFAAPITFISYNSGTDLGLKAFVAAVLGGIGNPVGAVAGGIGLGIAEALSGGYISSLYSDVIAFAILLAALFYRSFRTRESIAPSFAVRAVFSRIPEGRWRWGVSGAALAVGAALPILVVNGYVVSLLTLVVLYAAVVVGLDLLRGYTGVISLGHAAFMGIGAYATAILTTAHGWSPLEAMAVGMVISAAAAALFALVSVRLSGYNLALATLAFAVIFEGLMRGLTGLTGGSSGIGGVGDFTVLGLDFSAPWAQLYLALAVFAGVYAWSRALVRRQPGRMMKAVHADELAARSLGINPARVKTKVFILSAVIASALGSLYANFQHFVSPDQFGVAVSVLLLTMLVIGGEGTLWGGVIGVLFFKWVPEYFSAFSNYELLIEGLLLVVVLIAFPSGAAGGLMKAANWIWSLIGSRDHGPVQAQPEASALPEPSPGSISEKVDT